jgi:hypothetical protein
MYVTACTNRITVHMLQREQLVYYVFITYNLNRLSEETQHGHRKKFDPLSRGAQSQI